MCYYHARRFGCEAPQTALRICTVCWEKAYNDSVCGVVPTRPRKARSEWGGMCMRHGRLAGLLRNDKKFEDAKEKPIRPPDE